MVEKEQLHKALDSFKDWSNYLLITTAGLLGWVAKEEYKTIWLSIAVICFAISLIFAILTLSLIPLVCENIDEQSTSIYQIKSKFKPLWLWGPEQKMALKTVCWPQHIMFIFGVISYAINGL